MRVGRRLLAMIVIVAGSGGCAAGPTPSETNVPTATAAEAVASARPSRSEPSPPSAATPSPITWTDDEEWLLAGTRADVQRKKCQPVTDALPRDAIAGVECVVGSDLVDRVGFYAFADVASMMAVYQARMAQYGIPLATEVWPLEPTEEPRDCWRGYPSESFYWPNGEGTLINRSGCFVNELGYANLRFVLTGPLVYVGVLGNGAAIAPLYA